jgi:integrase
VRDNLLGGPMKAYRAKHGIVAVEQWSGDVAADYLRWLQHELRRDSATVKKQRSQLRSFGLFCETTYRVVDAGGGRLPTLRISDVTDFARAGEPPFTFGEAARLLESASTPRDRLAVALLLYTGMRPGELVALEEQHIRLDGVPPVVEVSGGAHNRLAATSPARFRDVPLTIGQTTLPQLVRSHLEDPRRPADASHLLLSSHRDASGGYAPLTLNGLRQVLEALGEATGIKSNAYRFRHTWCTWCADAGLQMLHMQQLLGHTSSQMVAYYYRGTTSQTAVDAAARIRF